MRCGLEARTKYPTPTPLRLQHVTPHLTCRWSASLWKYNVSLDLHLSADPFVTMHHLIGTCIASQ